MFSVLSPCNMQINAIKKINPQTYQLKQKQKQINQ